MRFLDKLKDMAGKHSDKADQGVRKAADTIDEKTGGKYSDRIDQGEEKAKDALRRQQGGDQRS